MTNNPVPPDRPHIYAFSTKRLVLLASMVFLLIALSLMLGIRIERYQQMQGSSTAVKVETPVIPETAEPRAEPVTDQQPQKMEVSRRSQKSKAVAPVSTQSKTENTKAIRQPEPQPTAQTKESGPEQQAVVRKTSTEAKKPDASAAGSTDSSGHYAIQAESSQDKDKAALQVELLEKKGFATYLEEADVEGRGRYYRVMIGPFQTRKQAEKVKDTLVRDSRYKDSLIRYLP